VQRASLRNAAPITRTCRPRICAYSLLIGAMAIGSPLASQSPYRLSKSEAHFRAVLSRQPDNPAALAGLGTVRMHQRNFLAAISYFERAKHIRPGSRALAVELDTARFRFFMGEGHYAMVSNDLAIAEGRYLSALEIRPSNPDAFAGLRNVLFRAQRARTMTLSIARAEKPEMRQTIDTSSVPSSSETVRQAPILPITERASVSVTERASAEEVYGPYVPYVPPAQPISSPGK